MSNLINDMLVSMASKCPVLTAPTDWKETEDCHVFITDLPGLKKDEVAVEVVDGGTVLQISGERKADDGDGKDTWHHLERCRGKFLRRFRLPKNANTEQLKASMENGVLVVTIPKVPVKKPETKRIEID